MALPLVAYRRVAYSRRWPVRCASDTHPVPSVLHNGALREHAIPIARPAANGPPYPRKNPPASGCPGQERANAICQTRLFAHRFRARPTPARHRARYERASAPVICDRFFQKPGAAHYRCIQKKPESYRPADAFSEYCAGSYWTRVIFPVRALVRSMPPTDPHLQSDTPGPQRLPRPFVPPAPLQFRQALPESRGS